MWFEDNSRSIGNTPLVRIRRIGRESGVEILAKLEGRNPSYSVKARIGAAMVWDAKERGLLADGKEIVEPTSGNTGIALAFVGAAMGIPVTLTMPDTMSVERRRVLAMLGANLVLTPGSRGMKGAIDAARELVEREPDRYFMPQQFENPANPGIHERTTGPEIWRDTDGRVDVLVCGVGTGGTITGVSRYFEGVMGKDLVSVAVEPAESPVITQTREGRPIQPGPHEIQGIGAGFIPKTLDLDLLDDTQTVTGREAIHMARRLAREEGILAGISSGAAMAAAVKVADRYPGATIVVVLPDAGERYLSTSLFELPPTETK